MVATNNYLLQLQNVDGGNWWIYYSNQLDTTVAKDDLSVATNLSIVAIAYAIYRNHLNTLQLTTSL
jgi:hypothetical protein